MIESKGSIKKVAAADIVKIVSLFHVLPPFVRRANLTEESVLVLKVREYSYKWLAREKKKLYRKFSETTGRHLRPYGVCA